MISVYLMSIEKVVLAIFNAESPLSVHKRLALFYSRLSIMILLLYLTAHDRYF